VSSEHIETVIIGGGQAGLSTGYHLKQRGRPFVILEGHPRLGDQWRRHWDTLRLYSPRKYDGLPGLAFPGDPWTYPQRDEVAAYVEKYALHHDLPVRTSSRVETLDQLPDGRFRVTLADGELTSDNVVVATGTFGHTPHVPDVAADLSPAIGQLHSSEYQRPEQVPAGRVLVVGASHSGTDIAYELAETHPVTLCGRDCGQLPMRPEQRRARFMFPVIVFVWRHVLTRRNPIGRKVMEEVRSHGGPMIRVHRDDLAGRGVERCTARLTGTRNGRPLLDDGTVVDASTVVWATGFRQDFDWIKVPVVGADGWPMEMRGVVGAVPGLYFCGLSFQFSFSSMVFPGIGRDAAYLAGRIEDRAKGVHKESREQSRAA